MTLKVTDAVKVSLATLFLRRIIIFFVFIFISKYISKSDLGIFRQFSLVLSVPILLSSFSIEHLFVIARDKKQDIFELLFRFTTITSILLMIILFIFSEPISIIYKQEILGKIIRVLAPMVFFDSILKILKKHHIREMDFNRIALNETINVLMYSALILLYIKRFPNVWLITIAFYLGNIVELVLFFLLKPQEYLKLLFSSFNAYKIVKDYLLIKKDLVFCTVTTVNHLAVLLSESTPVLIMGMYFPSSVLGVYYLANQIISIPISLVTQSIGNVFFSALAKMNKQQIKERVYRYLFFASNIVIPLFLLYLFLSELFIERFLDNKWLEALELMPILFIVWASAIIENPISSIPLILKKTQYELFWNMASVSLKILAMISFQQYGFKYSLLAFACVSLFMHRLFEIIIIRLLNASIMEYLKKMTIFVIPLIVMYFIYYFIAAMPLLKSLPLIIIMLVCFFIMSSLFYKGNLIKEIKYVTRRKNADF